MKRWKVIVLFIGGGGILSGLTLLIRWLLENSSPYWGQAVQAVTTLVLVGITGIYAFLTWRLVRIQEATPRAAAYVQAAARVLSMLTERLKDLYSLQRNFPLHERLKPSTLRQELATEGWAGLADDLRREAALLPGPLAMQTLETSSSIAMTFIAVESIRLAIRLAEKSSEVEGRQLSWSDVRSTYREEVYEGTRFHPEWDELLEGQAVKDGVRAVDSLATTLRRFLETGRPERGETPPFRIQ